MKIGRFVLLSLFLFFFFTVFNLNSYSQEPVPQAGGESPQVQAPPQPPAPPALPPQPQLPQIPGVGGGGGKPPIPPQVGGLPGQRPSLGGPPRPGLPPNPPPVILIRGKEFEMDRIFIESANIDKEIKVEFIMFDRDQKEKLSSKAYGLPTGATYNAEVSESAKSSASATFIWKPTDKEIGVHGIAFEVTNSKGDVNRIAIFYDVKAQ